MAEDAVTGLRREVGSKIDATARAMNGVVPFPSVGRRPIGTERWSFA
jgi:hypothetical protein